MAKKKRPEDDGSDSNVEPTGATQETSGSSVYARGQTVIPKVIREAAAIQYGTRLHWEVREGVIQVTPIPQRPVQALRGILKGTGYTFEQFMQERQAERQRERELEARQGEELRRQLKRRGGWPGTS